MGSVEKATSLGLARTIYIRCVYGIFGRKITIYTVIYGDIYTVLANPKHHVVVMCWAQKRGVKTRASGDRDC
jgi:hypothetical protein